MIRLRIVTILSALLLVPVSANAAPLSSSTSIRAGFDISGVNSVSYDGLGFDAFKPFEAFTNTSEVLSVSSFTGLGQGSSLQFTLISEVACFDGEEIPGFGNQFGVVDSNGQFTSVIDSNGGVGPGATGSISQGTDEELTLAIKSPQGTFTSIDSNNSDNKAHLLGLRVEKSGELFFENANLAGGSFRFNLLEGDLIIFAEDMFRLGSSQFFGGVGADFDYNDMVLVVRQTAVPEPTTLVLLGAGALVGLRRRKSLMAE